MKHFKILKTLDYDNILKQLSDHASTELGKQLCASLRPSSEFEEVIRRLKETDESTKIERLKGGISFGGIRNINEALNRAHIGGTLNIQECLDVASTLTSGRRIKRLLLSLHEEHGIPSIHRLSEQMTDHRDVEQAITDCISEEAEMRDSASEALRKIRHTIRTTETRVRERLEQMIRTPAIQKKLQDSIITIRNDRYVVPVKQEYRSDFGGMIHDQSASGATLFIEPEAIVNLNNQLREAKLKEQAEIEKILMALSAKIADIYDTAKHNVEMLAQLDFIFAKAGLARKLKCTLPRMNDRGFIKLNRGRHPLIDADVVVPIDLELGNDYSMIIVTGPNTGGKTVSLKTVGLLNLMAMSGLFIPAEDGSQMCVFDGIYADIGDEQSIEQNLSTFSSHMTNIIQILKQMTPKSLVLLDELGAGTDPAEGSALAISILEYIRSIGCRMIATTHYSELKAYAFEQKGIINASMEFDIKTLSPTYRLLIGIPGRSNAFAIAERLGLPRAIIESGKERMDGDEQKVETMLASLEANRLTSETELRTAEAMRKEVEEIRAKLAEQEQRFAEQKDKLVAKAKEEAAAIVKKAKQEADEIISDLRKVAMEEGASIKEHRLIEAKRRLDLAEPMSVGTTKRSGGKAGAMVTKVKPGEEVLVTSFGQKGHVVELVSDSEVIVQLGIMKMKVAKSDLQRIEEKKQKLVHTPPKIKRSRDDNTRMELDLRGKNLEESLLEVDQFLDEAYLAHLGQVYIIHGKGTGVLRDGIQAHLRQHRLVKSYRLGEFGEGGTGVTVATLK